MTELLELSLLGNPELRLAGQPLPRFRSAKVYALLYYLAMTRRTQPRTVLAGLFWGDVDEHYARRNLNRTLSDLTQHLGDHLIVERQSLAFARTQPYRLDVEALEAASQLQPTPHTLPELAAAADLYRGDFLDGFYVQDAPEFEQWVLSTRLHLRTTALQLLNQLAQVCADQGDLLQAMTYTRRMLQLEPWREEAHRQLMRLLARSGQRSAALAQYELCCQALRSELDVDPDAETVELVSLIRAGSFDKMTGGQDDKMRVASVGDRIGAVIGASGSQVILPSSHPVIDSVTPPPFPHNLPGQRTPFVGRATEVADITRLLVEEEDCHLLTIIGPGGMGKTRLALKAADEIVATPALAQRFGDGIYFIPLENVNDGNEMVAAIIAAITEESGQRLRVEVPLQAHLVYLLRAKSMLLILDNFEHLISQAGLLSDLLVAVPQIKLLVTARETVGLQEAWYYPLLGLSLPQHGVAEQKTPQHEYDAVRLFVQCARRTRADFALAAERAAVLRICTLVEGMPLGIELAAAWLKVMDCQQIAQELLHGLDFLTARYQNIPPRHRSMRVVMDHSWTLLSEEERGAIARLSIFRGRFRHEAARAIAGTSLLTLAALVEKALVRVTPDGHYQLHELTRQYAEERLTSVERSSLYDAHASYYATLLHQQQPQLYTRGERDVWAAIGGELDNIRHAWDWLIVAAGSGRQDLPVPLLLRHMAEPLAAYYLFQSPGLPGQTLFGNACEALAAAGWATHDASASGPYSRQALLVHIQLYQGLFHYDSGHYRTSLAVAEQALVPCRACALEEDLLLALLLYGRTQMRRGAADEAIQSLEEALALAQRLGSIPNRAEALISLG
ncbi:MAG: AAA family ATPase, partial [Caldilineaceae bacterium]|nr:AAA family ATPase [Caldilineaceae bacterium]